MKYYVDAPYPKIRVEEPNIEYARMLSNVYAGESSEESCILLYIYEHISLLKQYEEYSEVLKKIAIVEMHHLEMLGELINLLGMKPVYMSYDNMKKGLVPWNAGYLNYLTDISDVIDLDIKSEENAIRSYRYINTIIKDKYVNEVIERIIMDEELHLKIFKEFKEKFKKSIL